MRVAPAAGLPDVDAFIALEQLASEPYSRFVYASPEQSVRISAAMVARSVGEISPPFGCAFVDEAGATVGILAGPLSRKDLGRARLQTAQVIHRLAIFDDDPAVADRAKVARDTLVTLVDGDEYLSRIAVRPEARGLGLATSLLETFLERAKAKGGKRAILEVSPSHAAAMRLYARAGFEIIDERSASDASSGRTLRYCHMARPLV